MLDARRNHWLIITAKIFLWAFLLNMLWEKIHSQLYVHYKGGEITDAILFRAALFDAAIIALVGFFVIRNYLKLWQAAGILVLFAIGLEWFALATNRWAYNEYMPIIPFITTGLTPTVQLATIWYAIYWFLAPTYLLAKKQ